MLLLVCAIAEEIERFASQIQIVQIQQGIWQTQDKKAIIASGGVGYLAMALQLSKIGNKYGISKILFCGTAGIYPETNINWETIGLIKAKEVSLFDTATLLGHSVYAQFMDKQPIKATLDLANDVQALNVGTALSLTVNTQTAAKIAATYNVQAETMELYAVAKYAQNENIKWGALLGITNIVGENAHALWKANASKTYDLLARWFARHWSSLIV